MHTRAEGHTVLTLISLLLFPQLAKEADVLCQSGKDQQVFVGSLGTTHVQSLQIQGVKICRWEGGVCKKKKKNETNQSVFVCLSITVKELKALLPLVNYKAPSSHALKEKLQVWLLVAASVACVVGLNVEGADVFTVTLFSALLLQEVRSTKGRLDFEQFHKLYNHIMFEQNEVNLNTDHLCFWSF